MNYNLLGTSNLKISEIGFGCMSLGADHATNKKILHRAIDYGINFFDTADLYGHGENEITLGKAFEGIRKELIIATKVGNQWKSDGSGWDWNPSKAYILKSVEDSLKRLKTDYIDLYQLHGGTIEDPIDETIEAFEILLSEGKIRNYGISSIRPNVLRAYTANSKIASVMMQYSLLDRRPEESCLDLLHRNKIGVLARGSLAKGLLVDKEPAEYLGSSRQEVEKSINAIRKVTAPNRTDSEIAMKYVLKHAAITSAVVGIRTVDQLVNAVKLLQTPPLTDEEYFQLRDAAPQKNYDQHR